MWTSNEIPGFRPIPHVGKNMHMSFMSSTLFTFCCSETSTSWNWLSLRSPNECNLNCLNQATGHGHLFSTVGRWHHCLGQMFICWALWSLVAWRRKKLPFNLFVLAICQATMNEEVCTSIVLLDEAKSPLVVEKPRHSTINIQALLTNEVVATRFLAARWKMK